MITAIREDSKKKINRYNYKNYNLFQTFIF
uniref:Uncharacterized protein n=1 Tax=Siphoviridae sp. ctTic26 TaxID=2823583 RepID=A0A8S5LEQ2_9CAUD|nr:MAG TPA: hypothetical protein [Siphoviridae sp. ctTic26]DAN79369.1 MAG TPA: hypothetical protein [Caudoviricetes sp.]DAN86246.1 MAG TPA: hypothetical protein [Caudoviricetes sp.]DAO39491.1 MAG TPA: hypothetical protein [Caudoviricetes sp.]DAX53123.1 MAG TPA: hypothetical protein [Caudoviricetes sp.]